MKTKKNILSLKRSCAFLLVALSAPSLAASSILEIDFAAPTTPVSPMLHGLMTEEVNYSYDGGLYAELIRNRAFSEEAQGKPAHWSVVKEPGAEGQIRVVTTQPLTDKLPNSLEVQCANEQHRFGVANEGYWGIPIKPNTTYRASLYAKGLQVTRDKSKKRHTYQFSRFTGPLTLSLQSVDGTKIFAQAQTPPLNDGWQKFELALTTGQDIKPTADARFVISAQNAGKFWLSLVSLFPPTYKDRPNGFRIDLMEKLAAMKPKFLRFPGGNYLEGNILGTRFDWKATVGPLPFRPGHPTPWGYRSTDGMGLLEFMHWCEDLGVEPILGVYAGYSLQQQVVEPGPLLDFYVQEALEQIEYLTGDAKSTYWGGTARQAWASRAV